MAEIDIGKLLDYVIAVFPFAAAHVVIPPISFFGTQQYDAPPKELYPLFKAIYSVIPQNFFDPKFIYSLLLDKKEQYELSSQLLTHIFVHRDYNHLIANLQGTLMLGYPVFVEKGTLFFHLVYLLGGLFGTVPLDEYLPKSVPKQQTNNSWSYITDPLTKYANRIVQALGLERKVLCCGSSGAVCALFGVNFVLATQNTVFNLVELFRIYRDKHRAPHIKTAKIPRLLYSLMGNASMLYIAVQFLQNEWQGANHQRQISSTGPSVTTLLKYFTPSDSINHMAHLQGFGFGVFATLATIFYKP